MPNERVRKAWCVPQCGHVWRAQNRLTRVGVGLRRHQNVIFVLRLLFVSIAAVFTAAVVALVSVYVCAISHP